jgi:ABC-type nickel/cobalt efflux system permease component RcnA
MGCLRAVQSGSQWVSLYYELYVLIIQLQKFLKGELTDLVRTIAETGRIAPVVVALAVALGGIHALTPGHGKAVVLSYFLGRDARPLAGFSMAIRIALSHSLTAVLLVALFGGGVTLLGRPSGAASTLQTVSYALIALIGAYYLVRAIRPPRHDEQSAVSHVLPYAVGVLPCPLTMLVAGHAMVIGAFVTGLVLAGLMGAGAALVIGLFGTAGIIARRGLLGCIDPDSKAFRGILSAFEVVSSLFILLLGLTAFIGNLPRGWSWP